MSNSNSKAQPTVAATQLTDEVLEPIETEVETLEPIEETERETIILKNRTIKRVTKGENNRYFFELDGDEFKSFNRDGEEIFSNSFSKDITTFAKEVGTKHEALNAGFALASAIQNARLNPSFVSLCLTEAKITVRRTLKLADDTRQGMTAEDTYGRDTWINEIIDIKPNLTQFTLQLIVSYLQDINKLVIKQDDEKPNLQSLFGSLTATATATN